MRDVVLDGGHAALSWGPSAGLTLFSLQGGKVVAPSFGGGGLSATLSFWPMGSCSAAMATAGQCSYRLHLSAVGLFGGSVENGVNVPAGSLGLVLCGQLPNGLPSLCTTRTQARCTVIYRSLTNASPPRERILGRALVWSRDGQLEELGDNKPACVNPLSGVRDDADLSPEHNLGAAKLSNLTEATQPSLQPGLVGASCEAGLLRVSTPSSAGFQVQGEGVSRLTIPGFNLFFGDLRADARARLSTWYGRPLAGPIGISRDLAPAPIHAIP